ncbi:MAG: type II secretion system GspH family protein [Candidatus Omnitrophica bacterium]|jgi:type II secretory pathway pseudopilin PulG|nr:type II secretion system GspH family protein [Candidatus Omnitrophota bacterium]
MKNKKGLSIIEILVALIITGLIAACVSAAVISGYYMLKKAEHKSRAMSITNVKLQEYMAKSFDELVRNESGDDAAISQQFRDTQDNALFNWTVNVTEGLEGNPARIPYKNITVETLYRERNPQNESVSNKTIRMSNIVTYPLVHIASRGDKFTGANATLYSAPRILPPEYTDGMGENLYNWTNITGPGGVLDFNYRVPKDVVVMYNLAISYNTARPPDPDETVLTRCILDGNTEYGIITRTPIMSQIYINNILEMQNVTRGSHRINVQWCHESLNTTVWLRAYDVTVLAVENKTQ